LSDRLITALGGILLFTGLGRDDIAELRLWDLDANGAWSLTVVVALGLVFAWWARLHLGRLWSGSVTQKEGHRIVDTGPYAIVRHPIYTGLLLSAFATAAIEATWFAFAGAALMTLGFFFKARLEERFLRGDLGVAYDEYRRRVHMLIPFLALCLILPFPAAGAPPDLVVPFTPLPIDIDGQAEVAWGAAEQFYIGIDIFAITFRALHDGRTLYLLVDDQTDAVHDPGAGAAIWFDDQGGSPPQLADGAWTASACNVSTNRGEGRLGWFVTSQSPIELEEKWTEMTSGPSCPMVVDQNGSSAAIHFEEFYSGLATEVALPLEGSSALELASGQRFGLHVQSFFVELGQTYTVGFWPVGGGASPSNFGDVALAALRCNDYVEGFDPQFPADWVNDSTGGPGWLRSGAGGCGVANATAGGGEAACLVRGTPTLGLHANLVSPWFSLLGQSSASVAYRAAYADAAASSNRLDLEASTTGTSWTPLLTWTTTHGVPGGEQVTVDLSSFANEPRVRLRWRYSVDQGDDGNGAQIDQVRLECSPSLFSDGFESGLTTHWDAETP
jgi:protein-S-isoprenylcysteine O-methyltransferase Ste14